MSAIGFSDSSQTMILQPRPGRSRVVRSADGNRHVVVADEPAPTLSDVRPAIYLVRTMGRDQYPTIFNRSVSAEP